MYAASYFILKNHRHLRPRKFTLGVGNQALAWLKIYSTDQAIIGRWIMALEKYHFAIQHRPRTQHRNGDGLSKRTNDYKKHERQLGELHSNAEKWNFLSQEEYDRLPLVPWFDIQGRVIPNQPELPEHLTNCDKKHPQAMLKVARARNRALSIASREKALKTPLPTLPPMDDSSLMENYPEYPEDWIELTEECRQDYLLPTHVANVSFRTTYSLTGTEKQALDAAPKYVREVSLAINEVNLELHEKTNTVNGLRDLLLAQNRDEHILAIKKLVAKESIDNENFPENANNYYKQKKDLLLINANGVLCLKYPKNQRVLHTRPCMIIMQQLYYQEEILLKAHDAMGHQGIAKV